MNPISTLMRHVRLYGWRSTTDAVARKARLMVQRSSPPEDQLPFHFVTQPPVFQCKAYEPLTTTTHSRINIVIPGFHRGDGGIGVIFRLAWYLEQAGYDVAFYVFGICSYATDDEATTAMRS